MQNTPQRTLLITAYITPQIQEQLQRTLPDWRIEVHPAERSEDIPNDLWQNVEILYTLGNSLPTPEQVPNLRWLQIFSAGADRILNHPLLHSQVIITTSSSVHSTNIAEYVFMMQLAWFHHLPHILQMQQKSQWATGEDQQRFFRVEELRGKTIGIVGYGSIGREIARLAKAFGMRILAQQQSSDHRDHGFIFPGIGDPEGTLPDHYYSLTELHTLLQESDVVVIAVPLTPQTTHLFDEAAFHAMKPTAFLINIARGEVCDEQVLIRALQEHWIAGAALDVTETEPLPATSPLWQLPNVILSPHISGGTTHYEERAFTIFAENLRRYLNNQPLYNTINKERGY